MALNNTRSLVAAGRRLGEMGLACRQIIFFHIYSAALDPFKVFLRPFCGTMPAVYVNNFCLCGNTFEGKPMIAKKVNNNFSALIAIISIPSVLTAGYAFSATPSIKINGQDGPLVITDSNVATLTVSMNGADKTANSDWWLSAETPIGPYYYDYGTRSWLPGFGVTFQGALIDFGLFTVLNEASLPLGAYHVMFGVDSNMDGQLDPDFLASDEIDFIVSTQTVTRLPDTGQTDCYDVGGNVITCNSEGQSLHGQDANYSRNSLSYVDNGNGTITDSHTGLMWEKENDIAVYNWYEASGTADPENNLEGTTDVCGALTLAGHTDWRLPGIQELSTILHLGAANPSIDTVNFPSTSPEYYWTTTTVADYENYAWRINFYNGFINHDIKTNARLVRCVRGNEFNQTEQSLQDNNDGTVTDWNTGLIWQQSEGGLMDWESSLAYCEALSLADSTDWQLPNAKALQSLVDYDRLSPALNTTFFPDAHAASYWSSSTYFLYPSAGCCVDFTDGTIHYRSKLNAEYVRCVRGGWQ